MNTGLRTSPFLCEREIFKTAGKDGNIINGRFYTPLIKDRPEDKREWDWFTSVTTVIENAVDKGRLKIWLRDNTKDHIQRVLRETGDKGKIVHALIMYLIWGQRIDLDEEPFFDEDTGDYVNVSSNWFKKRLMCFERFWEVYQPVPIATEIILLNPVKTSNEFDFPYAGQIDFVGRIREEILRDVCKIKKPKNGGEVWHVDWKTGKSLYTNFGLQLTAGKELWDSYYPDEKIDRNFCLHLKDTWKIHIPYKPTEYPYQPETWLSTLDLYKFLNGRNGEFPKPVIPKEFPGVFNLYEKIEEVPQ